MHPRSRIIPTILFALASIYSSPVGATNYYVDCVNGNDGNSGTSPSSPWKKIAKAAQSVGRGEAGVPPGDVVTVLQGPCEEVNISFNRSALSGPSGGDCRASDQYCTIFRGDTTSGAIEVRPPAGISGDGFLISGGIDSVKFEGLAFVANGSYVFNEPVKVSGGGTDDLVFLGVSVNGEHTSGLFKILNGTSTATQGILIQQCAVQNGTTNGFVFDSQQGAGISDVHVLFSAAAANSGDGFVVPTNISNTTEVFNLKFESSQANLNGDDGFDLLDDASHSNRDNQTTKLINVQAASNSKAGIRVWRSAQIENAYVLNNSRSGIVATRHGGENEDTSTAKVNLVNSTVKNNASTGGVQINFERAGNMTARLYNTVAASGSGGPAAFMYDRNTPAGLSAISLRWDYNHFYRPGSSSVDVIRYVVPAPTPTPGTVTLGCEHDEVTSCDSGATGFHSNSYNSQTDPTFDSDGQHLTSSSPGWEAGEDPETISDLTSNLIALEAAHIEDFDGRSRPQDSEWEMGAFEGLSDGGC